MRNLKLILAIIWTILILIGCFISGSKIPKINAPIYGFDKFVHATFYFGLVILWLNYILAINKLSFKTTVIVLVSAFCFGRVIEILQSYLTVYRSGDVFDMLANTCGIGIGLVTFHIFKHYFTKTKTL